MKTSPRLQFTGLARVAASIAATAGLVFGGTAAANAAEEIPPLIDLTAQQEADMRAWWTDASVPNAVQDALIANLELGILPESSTDATPVSTLHDTAGGWDQTTYVYADGSRRVLSEQIPVAETGGVSTFATPVCIISGAWRINCQVRTEDAVSGASFVIDWRPATGAAQLRDMRAQNCWNSVGSCQVLPGGSIKRAVQSGTAPAWAELSFKAWVGPVEVANGALGVRAADGWLASYT